MASVGMVELTDTYCPRVLKAYFAEPLTNVAKSFGVGLGKTRSIIRNGAIGHPSTSLRVYYPVDHTSPGTAHSPEEVFQTDIKAVLQSDIILFHCHSASVGLGIEAAFSMIANIPRIILAPRGAKVSRMLQGLPTRTLGTIVYETHEDLAIQWDSLLSEIDPKDFPYRERAIGEKLSRCIRRRRIISKTSIDDLAQLTRRPAKYLELIENEPLVAGDMTLDAITEIMEGLGCKWTLRTDAESRDESCGHDIQYEDRVLRLPHVKSSLDELVEFSFGVSPLNEQRLFGIWDAYYEMQSELVKGRDPHDKVISYRQWRDIYQRELF
ncbi:hypothetical protein [Calycomorphotria hydatis]|uniref:Uncharacterized protein n=1 Tax=Calycomorphotria hydatis TaxID=2528027 RepID=A0A517TDI1_9PLAN|nr:hypothetical protein [Calycomorphotria hydatis]QDT66427.1 hypothetical protein V22_36940 [Calycomorphotria hydatis]